jgi:excisionase family DNA binding protein
MMQQQGGGLSGGGDRGAVPPGGAPGRAVAAIADLLTPAQVGEVLKLQEAEVVRLLEAGDLKGKKIGGVWRVKRSVLDAWLAD